MINLNSYYEPYEINASRLVPNSACNKYIFFPNKHI